MLKTNHKSIISIASYLCASFLMLFLLGACAASQEAEPLKDSITTEEILLTKTPDSQVVDEALSEEKNTSMIEVEPTEEVVDECLSCHTDKERLINTAKTEEEVISENEGEG